MTEETTGAEVTTEAPANTEVNNTTTNTEQNGGAATTETVPNSTEGGNQDTQAGQENAGTEVTDPQAEYQEIIQGWKEDRELLATTEAENQELRDKVNTLEAKLAQSENGEEEDKYAKMTPAERNKAIIADHQKAENERIERAEKEKKSELGFHRRTSPEFKKNEAAIIKIADDLKVNLDTATKVWKGQQIAAGKGANTKKADDTRKNDAAANTPGNTTTTTTPSTEAPAKEMSIAEIYRANGLGSGK